MPWCEDCGRFWNPPSVGADGQCPTCGRTLISPEEAARAQQAPWHFKLLVAAAAGYLLLRFVQGIGWVLDRL